MANEKIAGKNIGLYYNGGTDETPDYQLLVCLTETSLAGEVEVLEANSKCGTDAAPGNESWTSDFAGFATITPGTDMASIEEVIALFTAKEYKDWLITDNPTTPTLWREFEAFISSYEENYNDGESAQFSGTLTIRGSVNTTAPAP